MSKYPEPQYDGKTLLYERVRPGCPEVPNGFRRVVGNDHKFEKIMPDCPQRYESTYPKRSCGALAFVYTCLHPESRFKGQHLNETNCDPCTLRPGNEKTPPSEEDGVDLDSEEERMWNLMERAEAERVSRGLRSSGTRDTE